MISESSSGTKKTGSLAWKLSFAQSGELFSSYIKLDFLLIFLCFCCLLVWSEHKADAIYRYYLQPDPSIVITPDRDNAIVEIATKPYGQHFSPLESDNPQNLDTGYRMLHYETAKTRIVRRFLGAQPMPAYTVIVPATGGEYWAITILWEMPLLFLAASLCLLIIIQLFSFPAVVVRARNRMRKALQPIYELTATAQNITYAADTPLPLSGTIDALNTITGAHFDHRIPVNSEREELQGLAQAINSMLDRLNASYQAQLRFVSDASHELRTPISIIQGYARLLSRWGKDDPKTLQESIDAIQTEAEGMQILVEQLLFLARSDNQSLKINKELVDVSDMMSEVIRETEMISKGHAIVENIPPKIRVMADPQLLKQATRILVDNSIKYTPENGRITIGVENIPNEVCIHVGDNGVGIAPEELEHLFDRFWRADQSRDRKTGGTGLGLSIAHWIAEMHGGYISVVSRENAGSRFTIHIPKVASIPLKAPAM